MNSVRKRKLEKNFNLIFWSQAFSTVRMFSVVSTLFFLHRGLNLSQIFYLSIVWASINLLFEIPSSYLADKWGRKKTLILGALLNILSWIILIFARNIYVFIIAFVFSSLQYACFSGTTDALIYDSNKELGKEKNSLKKLGNLYSARHSFKIIGPIIAVLIAKNLTEPQFISILILDLLAVTTALIIITKITEANHYMDLEKQEAGVIKDAWQLIKKDWQLIKAILSRIIIFAAIFIIWRFHQKFFLDIGLPIIALGIAFACVNLSAFLFHQNIIKFIHSENLIKRINTLNYLVVFFLSTFVISIFIFPNKYWLLILFALTLISEVIRWPLYSELYNKKSFSFNRATTLSLSNFLKSILDIPLIFTASILIGINIIYPFIFSLVLVIIVIIFFQIPKKIEKT
jgi:MFS family permease